MTRTRARGLATASPAAGTDTQPDDKGAEPQGPAADVQAAMTVLGRRQLPPDGLRRLNLTRVDLRRVRLAGANLQGTTLTHANLQDAWLLRANLEAAELRGANLQGARLDSGLANLQGARLQGADLRGARLGAVHPFGAVVHGADLRGAVADEATRWPAGWDRAQAEARGVRYGPG